MSSPAGDLLQGLPELILEAHAGLLPGDHDRALENQRFHDGAGRSHGGAAHGCDAFAMIFGSPRIEAASRPAPMIQFSRDRPAVATRAVLAIIPPSTSVQRRTCLPLGWRGDTESRRRAVTRITKNDDCPGAQGRRRTSKNLVEMECSTSGNGGLLPPPLWGRGGEGGRSCDASGVRQLLPPPPTPPHKWEGSAPELRNHRASRRKVSSK